MKTNLKILALAAAVTALASCNKSEVVSISQPDAINFRTQVGMASKAASKTAFATGDKFNVWASYDNAGTVSRYFLNNFKFDGSYWYSDTTPYYWPAEVDAAHTLTFHAVWPETIETDSAAVFSRSRSGCGIAPCASPSPTYMPWCRACSSCGIIGKIISFNE